MKLSLSIAIFTCFLLSYPICAALAGAAGSTTNGSQAISPKTQPLKSQQGIKTARSTRIGDVIDSYRGVEVYYNGPVGNTSGRNVAPGGYNLGQKYQCVEFVKRFYYQVYNHVMPDSYGHAKDFFDPSLADGAINKARGLRQYKNGGASRPQPGDLLILGPTKSNSFGHVVIITQVTDSGIEYIQQNPGPDRPSRERLDFTAGKGTRLKSGRALGWLRK